MDVVVELLAKHGLMLVFVNVLLTQLSVPVPSAPTLILAGAFVAQGEIALAPLLAVAVAGSLAGDTPWYFAGRRYGYRVLHTLCRVAMEPDSCVKQTEDIFERWGPQSLVAAKYVPGFATVAPPLAGALRLAFPLFVLYSAIAALLWSALPIALGAVFHTEVQRALSWLENMGTGAAALAGAIVLAYVAIKSAKRYMLLRFLRMARNGAAELRGLMQQEDKPVVIDARSGAARKLDPRRIPGAVCVNIDAPEADLAGIPRSSELIVYCS
jgi:membrane protein DedA with SNARE-associated domain